MQNARCFHQPDQTKALQPSAAERIAPGQARPGLQDKCAASESQLSLFSFIWQTSAPVIDDNLFVVHELRAATPHWRPLWLPVRHKVWPEISGQQGVCAMRKIYSPPSNVNVLTLSHQVEDSRPAAIFMWANKTTVPSSRSVEAKLRPEPNETGLFARIGYTNKHSTDFGFYGIRTANLFQLSDMLVVLTPTWTHLMSQFYFLCLQISVDKLQFCLLGFFS